MSMEVSLRSRHDGAHSKPQIVAVGTGYSEWAAVGHL